MRLIIFTMIFEGVIVILGITIAFLLFRYRKRLQKKNGNKLLSAILIFFSVLSLTISLLFMAAMGSIIFKDIVFYNTEHTSEKKLEIKTKENQTKTENLSTNDNTVNRYTEDEYLKEVDATEYLLSTSISDINNILNGDSPSLTAKYVNLKMSAHLFETYTNSNLTEDKVPLKYVDVHKNYTFALNEFNAASIVLKDAVDTYVNSNLDEFKYHFLNGLKYWNEFKQQLSEVRSTGE